MTDCAVRGCGGTVERRYRLLRFDVMRCERCGMLFRDPLPDAGEIREMYDDPTYHSAVYFAADDVAGPEAVMQDQAVALLERSTDRRRLLDVGCGSGGFLGRAVARGWQCEGVELSEELARRCKEHCGVAPWIGGFEGYDAGSKRFDVVCMWDFLEHVRDPVATLEHAHAMLAENGILLVFTIDSSSLFNRIGDAVYRLSAGRVRTAVELLYDARHNFYFDRATLAALLVRSGFSVGETRSYRAYLGRWLAEPAPWYIRAAGDAIDALSVPAGRMYRQLIVCRRQTA